MCFKATLPLTNDLICVAYALHTGRGGLYRRAFGLYPKMCTTPEMAFMPFTWKLSLVRLGFTSAACINQGLSVLPLCYSHHAAYASSAALLDWGPLLWPYYLGSRSKSPSLAQQCGVAILTLIAFAGNFTPPGSNRSH